MPLKWTGLQCYSQWYNKRCVYLGRMLLMKRKSTNGSSQQRVILTIGRSHWAGTRGHGWSTPGCLNQTTGGSWRTAAPESRARYPPYGSQHHRPSLHQPVRKNTKTIHQCDEETYKHKSAKSQTVLQIVIILQLKVWDLNMNNTNISYHIFKALFRVVHKDCFWQQRIFIL